MSRESYVPLPGITRRGFLVLLIVAFFPLSGFLIGIEAEQLKTYILLVAGIFGLAFILESLLLFNLLRGLKFYGKLPAKLRSLEETFLEITVQNPALFPGTSIRVRPQPPQAVRAKKLAYKLRKNSNDTFSPIKLKFIPISHGQICWPLVDIRAKTALRLFFWQRCYPLNGEIRATVYPNDIYIQNRARFAHTREMTGERIFKNYAGEGREFYALRNYAVGDDPRMIDWKRSARAESVYVKTFQPESHQRIEIALDCSRRMSGTVNGRARFDYALDAVAVLASAAVNNRDHIGLCAFSLDVHGRKPAAGIKGQHKDILNLLVDLSVTESEADYSLVSSWARTIRRRSLLVLITSIANPSGVADIMRSLRSVSDRHLPLVVAIADQELEEMANQSAGNIDQAYQIAAAKEQIVLMQRAIAALKKAGIEAMYCRASELPERLEQEYYRLKISGRL
ncbi:MAG: DUF58 domain-containing protein [Candidatus Dadabacteria bacterium]|nr:MAG: DUF58 domain-containing protein [Candidatus Dadabacteria bacterium]